MLSSILHIGVCVCVYRQICTTIPTQVCFHSEEKEIAKECNSGSEHQITMNIQSERTICVCHMKEVKYILVLVYHLQV